jgi:hypothetical protein
MLILAVSLPEGLLWIQQKGGEEGWMERTTTGKLRQKPGRISRRIRRKSLYTEVLLRNAPHPAAWYLTIMSRADDSHAL